MLFEEQYEEAETLVRRHLLEDRMPNNTNTYQTLGDLYLDFGKFENVSRYQRQLNLENATASVSFTSDGVHYSRVLLI